MFNYCNIKHDVWINKSNLELHNVKCVGNVGGLLNKQIASKYIPDRQENPFLISASELSALFHLSDKQGRQQGI